jgi:DnaJ-class molecular chaperone
LSVQNTQRDYYAILGVSQDADPEVIKAAFRALAKKYHPDVASGSSARFREVNEAQSVLSDPTKRIAYDELIGSYQARKPSAPANTVHEDRPPSQQAPTTLNKVRAGMTLVGAALLGITLIFGLIVTVLDKTVLKH